MSRSRGSGRQRDMLSGEPETQRDLPCTARTHPAGELRHWPRHWAYALHGLSGAELDVELTHCPEPLREHVRFLVLEYLPTIEAFATGRAEAKAGLELADIAQHNRRGQR